MKGQELFDIARFARTSALYGAETLYNENGIPTDTGPEWRAQVALVANLFTIAEALAKQGIRESSV